MSRKGVEKKLWTAFSKFIRGRDASYEGYCVCISCGSTKPWKEVDAGHYISKGSDSALKFNEVNVNAQCRACNLFKSGNLIWYRKGLVCKYGETVVTNLENSHYMKLGHQKLSTFEMELLITYYIKEFNKLKAQKCLE